MKIKDVLVISSVETPDLKSFNKDIDHEFEHPHYQQSYFKFITVCVQTWTPTDGHD